MVFLGKFLGFVPKITVAFGLIIKQGLLIIGWIYFLLVSSKQSKKECFIIINFPPGQKKICFLRKISYVTKVQTLNSFNDCKSENMLYWISLGWVEKRGKCLFIWLSQRNCLLHSLCKSDFVPNGPWSAFALQTHLLKGVYTPKAERLTY